MDVFSIAGAVPGRERLRYIAAAGWAKRATGVLLSLVLSFIPLLVKAQPAATVEEAAVRVSAVVRRANPQIKLVWNPIGSRTFTYHIWRKTAADSGWGTQLATLPSTSATSYDDNTVALGTVYEYRIRRTPTNAEGYVSAGIDIPAIEDRGSVVLLVDNTHTTALAAEISQLQQDLVGDGWQVLRHDVAPGATPPQVKALIRADYLAAPTRVKAVFLLGNLAVPYSGAMNPDGHPDHYGAWPADVYYGDMRGTWTDSRVNTSVALRPANRNVPGDGKFDQSEPPLGSVDMQVGRVDLSDLSVAYFQLPEVELLRRYLHKDHQFRHKLFSVPERGLIDDHFGFYGGECFANNGWRNFSALLGEGNITAGPYFSTLATQSYLMAYACGGGSFFGANGVGNVRQYGAQQVNGVFNMMFGSYFGDWDNPDNFLRGALASDGYTLTNCWAGRPNWQLHHLGLGQTIGYATQLSQLGSALYQANAGTRQVHVALMGDPTLRLHVLAPPGALTATAAPGRAALSWTASTEAGLGYYIYRAASAAGPFTRITPQPVVATTFADTAPQAGPATYMVRAVQLKSSASGTYYNLSQGMLSGSITVPLSPPSDFIWRGSLSSDWNNPANWSSTTVPGSSDEVTIPAGTPFLPAVSGAVTLETLVLEPGARLTLAAGTSLTLRQEPQLQPAAAGNSPTSLLLAAGTAASPGGRLHILDHSTALAGLSLGTGTALTVGDYAEVRLLGHFRAMGGAVSFAPLSRLTFAHDPALSATGIQHSLSTASPIAVGVLAVDDPRETLVLNGPVQVRSQVENQGSIITNDNLTLLSSPGQQAILAPVTAGPGQPRTLGSYVGNVRVQVYVDGSLNPGLGYRHLSAPVSGPSVSALATSTFSPVVNPLYNTQGNSVTPFPTVFRYSQARLDTTGVAALASFDRGWVSPLSLSEGLITGAGYTVNMRANTTLSFAGRPYTSPDLLLGQLRRGNGIEAGWHLLGNPFAAPLSWNQLTASATRYVNMNPALYVFKSSGIYAGSYATYLPGPGGSAGVGINGGSSVLPVGQGFFVRTSAANGSLRFSLDDLLTAPHAAMVQRELADARPRLTLALRSAVGTQAHQTAVYFQAGATAGPDAAFDAALLPGPGQLLTLASISGGAALSINGLPALTGAEVQVPLLLAAKAAGHYQLAAETVANLPAGYRAYLLDAATGAYTDLAATPTSTVQLAANAPLTGRYSIVFSTQPRVLATAPAELAALVSLYPNPARGAATLTLPRALRGRQPLAVAVLNSLGQTVSTSRFAPAADELKVPLANLTPGFYTVLVPTTVGTVSRRLLVE